MILELAWTGVVWLFTFNDEFYKFYGSNLRGIFFTGFLTLGSLLLALKTFTLNVLKKDLYDSEGYRTTFFALKALDDSLELYRPLKELGEGIFKAMRMAFITSSVQVTFGLVPFNITALMAIIVALFTLRLVFRALEQIRFNLNEWQKQLIDPVAPTA